MGFFSLKQQQVSYLTCFAALYKPTNEVIEFAPTKEELKSLVGNMEDIVIQERYVLIGGRKVADYELDSLEIRLFGCQFTVGGLVR